MLKYKINTYFNKEREFLLKKSKIFAAVLAAVMALTMFAGCNNGGSGSDVSGSGDAEKTKFVLGLDDSFPPMGYRDDNDEIVGFDIDLAQAVCDELGMELVLQPIAWESKEMELNNGNIDCIWNGLSVDAERQEKMNLTKPYMENHMVVVVNKDSDIKSRKDLIGKNVGVQKGSTALKAASNDEFISQSNLVEYDTNVLALTDLPTGRIDAIVLDEVVANYSIKEDQDKYVVLDDFLSAEEYAIAFKKGNDDLKTKVEGAIDKLIENGKAAEISNKWFGKDVLLKD